MYLLDTNVVSELRKKRGANNAVLAWAGQVETASLFISVITVQELEIGVLLAERKDRIKGGLLRKWLDMQVRPAFTGRILPVDERVAKISAKLHVPNPRPFRDSLIAATAIAFDLTLVTRNTRDFAGLELKMLNPWL